MIWPSDNSNDIFSRTDSLDPSLCSSSLFTEFLIMPVLVPGIDSSQLLSFILSFH